MIDRENIPSFKGLANIARFRVSLGFMTAAVAFWHAAPTWSSLVLGGFIATFGEIVRVWAAGHIRKGEEVTTSGPYRFTRHPLYLGSFVIGVGFVVAAANVVATVIVILYLVVMFGVAITLDEATLRKKFGSDYDRYIHGELHSGDRSFSLLLAQHNGEYRTLLGFAAGLSVLGIKVWISGSVSGVMF